MPHHHNPYLERWRQREQFEAGMKLEAAELEPFLDSVFCHLGRRPPEIRLQEAARVVRFLRRLAWDGVPKQEPNRQVVAGKESGHNKTEVSEQERRRLDDLGKTIWNILLQNGPIEISKPTAAIRFLRWHEPTFLAHHKVQEAVRTIQALKLPASAQDPFPPPNLISRTITFTGKGNPRLSDDLSERIYGVHFALRRQGVRGVGPQIADVLTQLGVDRKRSKDHVWTYQVVQERVKQYKKEKSRELATTAQDPAAALERWSHHLADLYILTFRGQNEIEDRQRQPPQKKV